MRRRKETFHLYSTLWPLILAKEWSDWLIPEVQRSMSGSLKGMWECPTLELWSYSLAPRLRKAVVTSSRLCSQSSLHHSSEQRHFPGADENSRSSCLSPQSSANQKTAEGYQPSSPSLCCWSPPIVTMLVIHMYLDSSSPTFPVLPNPWKSPVSYPHSKHKMW